MACETLDASVSLERCLGDALLCNGHDERPPDCMFWMPRPCAIRRREVATDRARGILGEGAQAQMSCTQR